MTPFNPSFESHRARKFTTLGLLSPPLLLCLALSFSPVVLAELVNVTVDDQLGDPTTGLLPQYAPIDGTWHVGSPAEDCSTCNINPSTLDLSQIHEQTWHDATHTPPHTPASVTVHFDGSAVYVFNILPNTLGITTTFVNIKYSIDGEDAGTFTRSPDSSSTILYNQLVYRNIALEDGPHTLIMTAGGSIESLFLFDYLLYTTQGNNTTTNGGSTSIVRPSISTGTPTSLPQSSPESSSRKPVGAIVGGVIGGAAILLAIVALVHLQRRRTLRSRPTRIEARTRTTGNRHVGHGEGSEHDRFLVPLSSISPSSHSSSMWSLDGGPFTSTSVGTRDHDAPPYALDPEPERSSRGPGPDVLRPPLPTQTSNAATAPAESQELSELTDVVESCKRRAELTQRLETLQHTRSIPVRSSELRPRPYGPPGSSTAPASASFGVPVGSGTQRAMGQLEAEMAGLRGALAALSARVADSESAADERERGRRESLPAYAE